MKHVVFLLRFVLGIPTTSELSDELDAMFIILCVNIKTVFDYLGGLVDGAFG